MSASWAAEELEQQRQIDIDSIRGRNFDIRRKERWIRDSNCAEA